MTRKSLRRILLLGCPILALLVISILACRSSRRDALRQYKATLVANGEKLTFAMLYGEPQTNSASDYALFTNAISVLPETPLSKSGLNLREIVGPGVARVLWLQDNAGSFITNGTKVAIGWLDVEAALARNSRLLEGVAQALKDPPQNQGPWTDFHSRVLAVHTIISMRNSAHWFAISAASELHQNHSEDAVRDVESLVQLAKLNRAEYSLLGQMLRVAVANLAIASTWELLQAGNLTEAQLERLQKAWASLDLLDALETGFQGERAFGNEIWPLLRADQSKAGGAGGLPVQNQTLMNVLENCISVPASKALGGLDSDELHYLKSMQAALEDVRSLRNNRPWTHLRYGLDQDASVSAQYVRALLHPGYAATSILRGNFDKAALTCVRAETERQMTLAAIALARFRLEHGSYPESLGRLVPQFLKLTPRDYFSSGELHYRLTGDNAYVLYSVGEDGRDNGGDPAPRAQGVAKENSGIWESADALWPAAERRN